METKDLLELAKELVGIPYYYTEHEKNLSIGFSLVGAVLGFLVFRRLFPQTRGVVILASIIFVLSSILYWWIFETGGVYFCKRSAAF